MLKKIGTEARHQLESMLGTKVFLELFVKVRPNWREERAFIDTLDWRRQMEDLARRQSGESLTSEREPATDSRSKNQPE